MQAALTLGGREHGSASFLNKRFQGSPARCCASIGFMVRRLADNAGAVWIASLAVMGFLPAFTNIRIRLKDHSTDLRPILEYASVCRLIHADPGGLGPGFRRGRRGGLASALRWSPACEWIRTFLADPPRFAPVDPKPGSSIRCRCDPPWRIVGEPTSILDHAVWNWSALTSPCMRWVDYF